MKRVCLFMLLIMAFMPLTAMTYSFADRSPPGGVEISIDYDVLTNVDLLNVEAGEVRIAVFDCDLKLWPINQIAINIIKKTIAIIYIQEKAQSNQTMLIDNDPDTSDQVSKPVNKHGITDKEVCYTQNLYSYLIIK